jgi:septal ring factor EnvC (AmiA/AmiB activator)
LLTTTSETTADNVTSILGSVSTLTTDVKSIESVLSRDSDRTSCLASTIDECVPKIRDDLSAVVPQIQSKLPKIELSIAKVASESSNINQALTVMTRDIGRVEEIATLLLKTQDQRTDLMEELLDRLHQSRSQQHSNGQSLVSMKPVYTTIPNSWLSRQWTTRAKGHPHPQSATPVDPLPMR